MLQGICIDKGQSMVLEKGKNYFLFPNGPNHFYVSNFPSSGAHNGCFQAKFFQLIEKEEWSPEPESKELILDKEKVYKANLIWRKPGYKMVELKGYYVRPRKTHCDFYHDNSLDVYGGCFPFHWFANFVKVGLEDSVTECTEIVMENDRCDQFLVENEPNLAKYVQLSLFDF